MHFRPCLIFLLLGAALFTAAARAENPPSAVAFVQQAAIDNQFEITLNGIAFRKSRDPDIRRMAQRMIKDHSRVAANLKQVLAFTQAPIPIPDPAMDAKHQKILDRLDDTPSNRFDRRFMETELAAHKRAAALFRSYARAGDSLALRNFAHENLPVLEAHLKSIREMQAAKKY